MKRSVLRTSTFFVIFFVYTFAIFSWVTIQSFNQLVSRWSHDSELTIYLRPETTEANVKTLRETLNKHEGQTTASFQSIEALRETLKKIMPKSETDFTSNEDLVAVIPPHFIVKGQSHVLGDSLFQLFQSISAEVAKFPFVESSDYGKSWIDRYSSILGSVKGVTLFFLCGLSLSLVLVIGNAIRSHLNSRRDEIEILELVGATQHMVRKPFLIEGTCLSTLAMTVALILVTTIIHFLQSNASDLFLLLDLKTVLWQVSFAEALIAIVMSAGIGLLGSYLCLSEINTGWAATGYNRKISNLLHFVHGRGPSPHG